MKVGLFNPYLRIVLLSLALSSIACATYILAAPNPQSAGAVTVVPDRFYTGDAIEITLTGFTAAYLVPAGAVTLGGVRIPIPGVFDTPGVRPMTDNVGNVTFSSRVPLDVPYGEQSLVVTSFTGDGERTITVTVLGAELSFAPGASSPNQQVVLRGMGFSPVTNGTGKGPLGVHQVTGQDGSGITVNGTLLGAPYVTYPVNLDSDGGLTASVILPESYVSLPSGTLEIKVVDDAGRSGVGVWAIKQRTITLSPTESGRGGRVTVSGTGFLAAGRSISKCLIVDIAYAGTKLTKVRPDSSGSFQTSITVPAGVAIASSNTIMASIPGCSTAPAATATHKVPDRSIKVIPFSSQVGTLVQITGVSFIGFTLINKMTIGTISVLPSPPPFVAEDGSFSVTVVVPKLNSGSQTVKVTVADLGQLYTRSTTHTINGL